MLGPLLLAIALADPQVKAAYGVLERTIGPRAKEFRLERLVTKEAGDAFSIEARNGRVTIKGTTGVAICRGAYEYLKDRCNSFVSWEGSNIRVPARLPDQPYREGRCAVRYRHYYNICTFGYTTAFWDWKRWEREVDWMALHGINMPLSLTGQDQVWRTVFRSLGVPDSSLARFFSGPAFQPWHWMGNLNGHGGPTTLHWIEGQAALQKKIFSRERSLGMNPVVPGFSGFVPTDFSKYQPKVRLQSPTAWCGFEPTTFVDIRDPMFVEIGKRFVQEYRKLYGTSHLYLCDTFNEQNPQFPEATKLQDLANAGRSVYEGLKAADPDATWVMQGWLFYNERNYWREPEIEALLSKVPDGKMVILDLSCEQYEVWRNSPAVAKKGFIYCTLHNFGQNTALGGDLQGYVDKQSAAAINYIPYDRAKSDKNLLGYGLTPEGIDQNPVVYELMTDAMWDSTANRYPSTTSLTPGYIDVAKWLRAYARARYGADLPEASRAWEILQRALYSKDAPWYHDAWRGRPGRGRRGRPLKQMKSLEQALTLMLAVAPKLRTNALFQRDLVDVCKTWLGGIADREALAATDANASSDENSYLKLKAAFCDTLNDLDHVMATRPEHRLQTWIDQARAWASTPTEKDWMERNALLQVTAWDGKGVLTDYANKEWAGLNADFLAGRWKLYFEALEAHKPAPDYLKFETSWVDRTVRPKQSPPGDPVTEVRAVFDKYRGRVDQLENLLGVVEPPGNLAREGSASDDGNTEPGGSPSNAIDGDLDTYWASSPYPREWRLDLGAIKAIKTIQVFPYWGDGRYYQYTIDISQDGKGWKQVVDMSKNEEPSSSSGHRHVLAQASNARYVRIKMLKNSANVGVHLVEVRVFEH